MIGFTPKRGAILICDFDLATVPPEMRKKRRVAVVSPRSYNRPVGHLPGKCIVVPFSATEPRNMLASHIPIAVGTYASLSKPVWAICEMIAHVSHVRLDRVAVGRQFVSEELTTTDIQRIEQGILHALGISAA